MIFYLAHIESYYQPLAVFIELLQLAYAQESDEEADKTEVMEEEEDEENGQTKIIDLCCSWDKRIADGILTYTIIEEEDEDEENEDDEGDEENHNDDKVNFNKDTTNSISDLRKAVTDAVNEWNTKIPNLKLVEISSTSSESNDADVDADIEVLLVEGFGGMVAGATMIRFDEDDFINGVTILLPKAALYVEHDSDFFAILYDPLKLKEIATHEVGHALGLGHATFDFDLMSRRLSSDETVNISKCDVKGVLQANQWKLVNNNNTPDKPNKDEVSC